MKKGKKTRLRRPQPPAVRKAWKGPSGCPAGRVLLKSVWIGCDNRLMCQQIRASKETYSAYQ